MGFIMRINHFISMYLLFSMSFVVPTSQAEEPVIKMDQSNNILYHLLHAASQVTHNPFQGIQSLEDWEEVRPRRYQQFLEMMSLTDVPIDGDRPPLNVEIVDTIQEEGFKIIKLYYESLPQLYVPANLYIPDDLEGPVPGVLYVCGHSRTQKVNYQAHPRRWAELGFVCLIIETIQWGEVRGHHWGCYSEGRFNWYSRGYTPGGVELWNSIRGLDLLCEREEVDSERLGVTGISGGGAYSWYVAAADPRIKVAAPVCGTSTVESHLAFRTIDGHCDCMMPINTYRQDFHDIGALIAPRPLLVASAERDQLNVIESVRQNYKYLEHIYNLYDAPESLNLMETPGGHSYHETSRKAIFSYFMQHLMDKQIPPEEIEDIEESSENLLSEEELEVYVDGAPEDDRTITIDESFQEMAEPPQLISKEDWQQQKNEVIAFLKEKTFGAFPQSPPELDTQLAFRGEGNRGGTRRYTFVSEPGYRLKMEWHWSESSQESRPLVLVLRNPGEERRASESFASPLPDGWNRAFFSVRGVGDTSWGPELQWHVRRAAAWTGRTLASMRVYDVLRCLEAIRELEIAPEIAIAARGEMAVIALYAALLDGEVHTLLLQDLPETQDQHSAENGRGEAIEMLNCLRITDVPQVAGLVWPTKVGFVEEPPATYMWAINTHEMLDQSDDIFVLERFRDWSP